MNSQYPHYPPTGNGYAPQAMQAGWPGRVYPAVPASMVYPPPAAGLYPAQAPMTVMPPAMMPAPAPSLLGSSFVKGAMIGAIAAYLLTNEKVQQGAIKTAVKSWSVLQGGIEEMKERFRDAEAELHAAELDEE